MLYSSRQCVNDFIKIKEPAEEILREHIIRGDKGDGVPNIHSEDDSFVEGKRQRPIVKHWLLNGKRNNQKNG